MHTAPPIFFRNLCIYTSCLCLATSAWAQPQGGVVNAGSATIQLNGDTLAIHQSSDKAIIDWQGFDIHAGETTRFIQPGTGSVTLNRIHDIDPSQILGNLSSNGQLMLINPHGMVFGAGSKVDVAGLIASSADITNADFLNGNYNFSLPGVPDALIRNAGTITVKEYGMLGLVAPQVENSGVINARLGKVALASGDTFTLDFYGDDLISVAASGALNQQLLNVSGSINAAGGSIALSAAAAENQLSNAINISGSLNASGKGTNGGEIKLSGYYLDITGTLDASGNQGGSIAIDGHSVSQQGLLSVKGLMGIGGNVDVRFTGSYLDSESSGINADGSLGGGHISVGGGENIFASGFYHANGNTGGSVNLLADTINLFATRVDVSGSQGGGRIRIGGGWQGGEGLQKADTVKVNGATKLKADSTFRGKGGVVNIWSEEETRFAGSISAKGGSYGGNGGKIEVSSHDTLHMGGKTDASALSGTPGSVLLDPKNIIISNAGVGGVSYFEFIDPNPGAGNSFGNAIKTLSTGNVVISNPLDDFAAGDAGAVYLFNGATGGLISTLRGSTANDQISNNGIYTLTGNGNYVISSTQWDNGGAADAGAATWGSGTAGISGSISALNSLVGSSPGDAVSANPAFSNGVVPLTNGNYVVATGSWDNAGANVGAVTWGNGSTGVSGTISAANSLTGSVADDRVGFITLVALTNGNYVSATSTWDNGGMMNVGAVTWGNGATGTTGVVTPANSLVGGTALDRYGIFGVTALPNGNYVTGGPFWINGGAGLAGAVTWGNGATGTSGVVTAANSIVGSTANDQVGCIAGSCVTVLDNGNFLITSSSWDNVGAGAADAGAVTWMSGTGVTAGAISAANSLIGSTASDNVGSAGIVKLTNGNYLVRTPSWDDGVNANVGAVTWGSAAAGVSGTISNANSLVGNYAGDVLGTDAITTLSNGNYVVLCTACDDGMTMIDIVDAGLAVWGNGTAGTTGTTQVLPRITGDHSNDFSNAEIVALTNGNYVVRTPEWDNGGTADAGAATWASGALGTTALIDATTSLVGLNAGDNVGDRVTALTNGNYVVRSSNWSDGVTAQLGAITWGNGTSGITGTINAGNSLIGSTASDSLGNGGILALNNGNYVVASPNWDNGGAADAGAATWGNGNGGTVGTISAANSLVGSTANDFVSGNGVAALSNGNYVVNSASWNNGGAAFAGAVTWGNGTTGTSGVVSAANSLVGSTAVDRVGSTDVIALNNGNYVVYTTLWDNGGIANAGAITWGSGTAGVSGTISTSNSVVGSTANDQLGSGGAYLLANGNLVMFSPLWDNGGLNDAGAATLLSGTASTIGTVGIANSIVGVGANDSLNNVLIPDTVNNRFIVNFTAGGRNVYSGSTIPLSVNDVSFALDPAATVTLSPAYITNTLNTGTAVILQANNDITVNDAITANNPLGNGGNLTFQAGRSILLNANITTDNGNFSAYANSTAADGVVDAHRDPGNAVITMNGGTQIDAGSGMVTLQIKNGSGLSNRGTGDLTLADIIAGNMLADNTGAGNVVLNGNIITTNNGPYDVVLAAEQGNFINNVGAGVLNLGTSRFLIYSTAAAADMANGLLGGTLTGTYAANPPASIAAAGNQFIYSSLVVPTGGGGGGGGGPVVDDPEVPVTPEPPISGGGGSNGGGNSLPPLPAAVPAALRENVETAVTQSETAAEEKKTTKGDVATCIQAGGGGGDPSAKAQSDCVDQGKIDISM